LLNHLEGRAKLAIAVQEGREARNVTNDVFYQLTYEVIRTINVILKFGSTILSTNTPYMKPVEYPTTRPT
jgi:hypothetical protein